MADSRKPIQGEVADAFDVLGSDGWITLDPIGDAYAYVSATQFTITSAVALNDYSPWFKKGTRVKLTNSTVKYFVCSADSTYSAGVTTITITGGSDYSLANAAISALYISFTNPPDMPIWFNWTPTLTGYSANPTGIYRFALQGNSCRLIGHETADGTSNATTKTYSLPITAKTITNQVWNGGPTSAFRDNGATTNSGRVRIVSAATVMDAYTTLAGGTWTASGAARVSDFAIEYEI